jgi:3',5'-cyclic AMP phosphodiesterase CpdA
MKLAWLTDIHLNFLSPPDVGAFLRGVAEVPADAVLLGGDIGEADDVARHLDALDTTLQRPVYFVLGNHDFYRGSIAAVRAKVSALCSACPNLHWLPEAGVVPLTGETGLVGHDGWADGRLGNYWGSDVELSDWGLIADLAGLDRRDRLAILHQLGDEAAAHLRAVLPDALARFRHVLVLTHVPPFRNACWYRGRVSGDDWLPHMTCKVVGDALADAMTARPDRRMTVLCGHTHGAGEAQILPNLRVLTGGAVYGRPVVQQVLEAD